MHTRWTVHPIPCYITWVVNKLDEKINMFPLWYMKLYPAMVCRPTRLRFLWTHKHPGHGQSLPCAPLTGWHYIFCLHICRPKHANDATEIPLRTRLMGPTWAHVGRQEPGGSHVGPMNYATWDRWESRAIKPRERWTCWRPIYLHMYANMKRMF